MEEFFVFLIASLKNFVMNLLEGKKVKLTLSFLLLLIGIISEVVLKFLLPLASHPPLTNKQEYLIMLILAVAIILAFTMLLAILALGLKAEKITKSRYEKSLNLVQDIANGLVETKKDRFRHEAKFLKPTDDVFDRITKPEKQINKIFRGIEKILAEIFEVKNKNISMTIMEKKLGTDEDWFYRFKSNENREYTEANDIMAKENDGGFASTARRSYDDGDEIFISNIISGIESKMFLESKRSKKAGNKGSIYCRSFCFYRDPQNRHENKLCYIFSLGIYDDNIFELEDEFIDTESLLGPLRSLLNRLELELCLYAIQSFKKPEESHG